MEAFEDEFRCRRHQARRFLRSKGFHRFLQSGNFFDAFEIVVRCHLIGDFNSPTRVEVFDDFLQRIETKVLIEDFQNRPIEQLFNQLVFLLVLAIYFVLAQILAAGVKALEARAKRGLAMGSI